MVSRENNKMFANKVVIVTGGSAGIGAATAEFFAKEGADIAIVGRNDFKLNDVAQRCKTLGANVLIIKADVSKEDEAKTIVEKTVDKFGKLDVLINNAGIVKLAMVDEGNMLDVYDEVINTNLRSTVQISNLAAPHLKETKGNIINVSSVAGRKILFPGIGLYSISKAGIDIFTKSSAIELASSGVRVNSVNPGPVSTEIIQTVPLPEGVTPDNFTILGKVSEVEEIAELILFLASDKAKSITGSSYVIDNGMLLK